MRIQRPGIELVRGWQGIRGVPASTDVQGAADIGTGATLAVAVAASAWAGLADLGVPARRLVWAVAVVAGVGTVGLWTHLRRPERVRWPWRWLVGWSVATITLVSIVVAATGGASSDLAFLFVLPVLFFTALLGPAEQVLLLLVTASGFATAVVAAGTSVIAADLLVRAAVIAVAAWLSSYLAGRLRGQAEQHRASETLAERRAQLLAVSALAARSLSRLEVEEVLDNLVRAAAGLGFRAVALFTVQHEDGTCRCRHQWGLPAGWGDRDRPVDAGLVGEVVTTGQPRAVPDYQRYPGAVDDLRTPGFRAVAAVPVLAEDGRVGAVLTVADTVAREFGSDEVEALELLASVAGVALGNARRYRAEQRAREQMQQLARVQEDFVATASHELRTPLTVVRGAAELLDRRWDELGDRQKRDFVGRITRHSVDLARLADQLLRFGQLGSAEHEPVPSGLDLAAVVTSVLDRAAYVGRDHHVACDIDAGVTVLADADLLETALEALVDNAGRHTPAGTTIRVGARRTDGRVRVVVADDGPGIPSDEREVLARAFRRGGDALTRPTRGIGLGLSTASRIADLHGGELRLESPPEGGTRVSFDLPVLDTGQRSRGGRLRGSRVIHLG